MPEILIAAVLPVYFREFTNIYIFTFITSGTFPSIEESSRKAKTVDDGFETTISSLRDKHASTEMQLDNVLN